MLLIAIHIEFDRNQKTHDDDSRDSRDHRDSRDTLNVGEAIICLLAIISIIIIIIYIIQRVFEDQCESNNSMKEDNPGKSMAY